MTGHSLSRKELSQKEATMRMLLALGVLSAVVGPRDEQVALNRRSAPAGIGETGESKQADQCSDPTPHGLCSF